MPLVPEELLEYWFREVGVARWFKPDATIDAKLSERYLEMHERAVNGALSDWEANPTGMLGLMLLLDQFPRRMFRGTPRAFATDELALDLARTAIIKHFDDRIDTSYKLCFYLPFAHSENMGDQRLSLFYIRERTKNGDWLDYAESCYNTIQTFDRFPDRNKILGRASTKAEEDFLTQKRLAEAS
ncbi:MAG: DUF924 domain-containing protein [Alphaproteobacteria bacterium]|nr:DUF924 domain-containing protein [Alphaproteobacteria bacterium]